MEAGADREERELDHASIPDPVSERLERLEAEVAKLRQERRP
jgi:hypothetical protein